MRILIFALCGLGDSLMFTPALHLLRQKYPDARIEALTMLPGAAAILKDNPNLDEVLFFPLMEKRVEGVSYLLSLRSRRYDVSILIYPSYRREYNIASALVGAKKRVAHRYASGQTSELSFLNNSFVPADKTLHNVENDLNLLQALDITRIPKKEDVAYVLRLPNSAKSEADAFLKQKGLTPSSLLVALHPGSTDSPAARLRRWPAERYGQVAKSLIDKKGARVLVFAGRGEMEEAKKIIEMAGSRAILVSGLSLSGSCSLLSRCRLLISNDNGFGHIASALSVPLITLWGSTNPDWSLPIGKKVRLIRKATFTPWYSYELKRRALGPSGMDEISVSDVTGEAQNELG